ncbi:MAG: hypothetical protein PQJ58_16515, partial [Spirochaetales bacterium]|nr:hypothetical protein [Spirochaetales bacterium]
MAIIRKNLDNPQDETAVAESADTQKELDLGSGSESAADEGSGEESTKESKTVTVKKTAVKKRAVVKRKPKVSTDEDSGDSGDSGDE